MDTITFVVHPEWIKREDRGIYRDLCAALRTCLTHLQYEKPDWNIVVIHSDEKTLTVSVDARHSLNFVESMYQLAGEIVHLRAEDWLRMSKYELLSVLPDFAEPPPIENAAPDKTSFPGESQPDYLNELCSIPMMQEYPMLADCLRSQAETIRMLRKMGLIGCTWEQNLLVAMDDDADFDAFRYALSDRKSSYIL